MSGPAFLLLHFDAKALAQRSGKRRVVGLLFGIEIAPITKNNQSSQPRAAARCMSPRIAAKDGMRA
jgi:hypothetical protein